MIADERTLTPGLILELYCEHYVRVYKRAPIARYMGHHWYNINGETVHRSVVMEEIDRLHALTRTITQEVRALREAAASEPPVMREVAAVAEPPPAPVAEPALAGAGIPAARVDRGLINRLINRLRGL